jgi:sugar-specific transcriptional regulator TrmB
MQIKNPSLIKELQKVGLSDKEALVYVALLELSGAYPSRIAEYSGLKRATTYNVLTTLSVRGLVNEIEKRNKIFYQIDKPNKLIKYSNSRVEQAKDGLEKAEKILPDLESLFSLASDKPKVLFFEGVDTVSRICDDMVAGAGNYEMLAFSNAKKINNLMTADQLKDFVKNKERLNIHVRGIIPNTKEDRDYSKNTFEDVREDFWPKVKYMPAEKFPYEAEITIYGTNKVSITKLGGENIIGVIIEDKIIHDMMKMIFELAWGSAELTN